MAIPARECLAAKRREWTRGHVGRVRESGSPKRPLLRAPPSLDVVGEASEEVYVGMGDYVTVMRVKPPLRIAGGSGSVGGGGGGACLVIAGMLSFA